ncbi:Trm112 family protein [Haloechinothrix sp. LS1_15]|uniref:Trm112 family protein n=1 Tax=Haloechinothrix sp. LS1_15 TaxID=2652248 RepID=UPI0029465617|nr:Trm112 family protein [Haloechinothrix sp. LS1_15]MDV6011563.1 Trm112 family protein [Haloechinothrix sp. LS1_15]
MAFTVDKQLLEILACPARDHGPLVKGTTSDPGADVLTCTECGRQYPIRDGIPVLLLDESHRGGDGGDTEAQEDEPDDPDVTRTHGA